jgi:autotransporter-associated beta strand protein
VKITSLLRHLPSIASCALLCIFSARAADVTWDITPGTVGVGDGSVTGGSGAWNTSTGNWTTNGGVNNRAWINANNDTAIFSGTPGTITLGTGITVGGLIFNTPDYSLAGSILTFGTGGTIIANENAAISSALAGSTITKTGNGTLVLSGNDSYTGPMTVSAGMLAIGDGAANGTLSGSYLLNSPGTLRVRYNTSGVQAAWTGTIWNNFTGNGTLALATGKSGDEWGNAALTGDFTGTLQIEGGRVGTDSVTGSGFGSATAIKVLAGGQIMDWRGRVITQDLTIAGTGYGEGGYESAIRMSDETTPSILSGLVNLSANATIGARSTGILMNVISGAAGSTLTVGTSSGNGTVIFAADNTYAGATIIAAGTLQIGNAGATGALGAGAVTNNGTLVFSRSGNVNVVQSITGSGALMQEGSGNVILSGNNNYLGATTVSAGTLTLGGDGALPTGSEVSISGATLHAGISINSAGTLGVTFGGTGPSKIIFGSGAALAFANSTALIWTDFLQLGGNFVSGVSLRVGTTSSGLTPSQLQRIIAPGFAGFGLNAQGYVTATAYTVANYNSWQMVNNTNQSFSEDFDGDGVPNGIEYFLHGPGDSSGNDVLPSVTSSAGIRSVTWTKAATYLGIYGKDFVVQTSSTLVAGTWANQTVGSNLVLTGNSVRYIFPAGDKNFVRLVAYGTAQEGPLVIDTSNAIPLRNSIYRTHQFTVSLQGSAIKPNNGVLPFDANFDTGSWQTCLPYGALNKANLTVDATNIRTDWGTLADKVRGQLILKSRDGLTSYTANDFTFYAMKNPDGSDMADDRFGQQSNAIVGAFPTLDSIVAVLTAKYSTNGLGSGIISESPGGDFVANWSSHKSYLKFGNDPAMAARLNWYNWKPWFTGQADFDPIVVPGFKVSYRFPAVAGQTYPDLVMPNLIATIDTGAPDLTMRLGPNNPQLQDPYSQFFNTTRVPSWYSPDNCRVVNYGVTINVDFTGSTGKTNSYSFPTADTNGEFLPNTSFIGHWNSRTPWFPNNADMPTNRFNLGNNIFFFCKVYYWDLTNQRVGFFFD